MQTINFLTSHFIPENTAATNRVLSFINEFEKQYKVNVVCLSEKGVSQKKNIVLYSAQITIYYVNQDDFNGKNFFLRAFNEVKYISKLLKISKILPHDIVVVTSPYMFMIPLVGFGVTGKKVLDIRDLVWEYLDEKGLIKKIIKKVLTSIMKSGIKRFDHITVSNNYEYNLLSQKYEITKVDIIPNGIDILRYEQLTLINPDSDHPFTVTYVGNIGLAQNLKVLIDTAKQIPDIEFLIIGDGIEAKSIKEYAKDLNIKNITFTGKLEWDVLKNFYKRSSILYAQLDKKYVSAMPSKLYEYASLGLPIIYGGVGQAKLFIDNLENAITIPPNNVKTLVAAIKKVKEKSSTISNKNRELINKKYLRESAAIKINHIINYLNTQE